MEVCTKDTGWFSASPAQAHSARGKQAWRPFGNFSLWCENVDILCGALPMSTLSPLFRRTAVQRGEDAAHEEGTVSGPGSSHKRVHVHRRQGRR